MHNDPPKIIFNVPLSRRGLERAIRKQHKGYPRLWHARTVPDTEWVSQFDAGAILDISILRVGLLIAGQSLKPVHSCTGQAGISAASVRDEEARRRSDSRLRRAGLLAADLGRAVVHVNF